jgi:cytochrome c oxidase subunit II
MQSLLDSLTAATGKLLGLPVVASVHGRHVDQLIIYVHWLMIVLFVGWIAYFAYALFRFHHKRHPKADYLGVKSHVSNYIEGLVAVVEGVLLIGLAVPLWARAVDKFPAAKDSTVVQIVAQQFVWNVRYPGPDGKFGKQDMRWVTSDNVFGVDPSDPDGKDDVQVLNEVHVVVNKPVIIYVSSKDVIHSLKIIAMRVTQDAIPGLRMPVHFTPTKTGIYQINCAQLCGNGHSSMSAGRLIVESQEDYNKWIASKVGAATSFD